MKKSQLLTKIDRAWQDFNASYDGLSQTKMVEPGVMGEWSVKDILAHVVTWEEEAVKFLPLILQGRRPPRYSVTYGGIDAFNALMTEQKRCLALPDVLRLLEETHARLVATVEAAPDAQLERETPFRRRLRLDTYSHYPIHARAIRAWRDQAG